MSPFLTGITWLLLFQCAGEALVWVAALPIPGPVAGMALLLIALLVRGRTPEAMSVAGDGLAKHLSLLFVPAGVGVMQYAARLTTEWLPIVVALGVSTMLAVAATAITFRALVRRQESADAEHAR